MKLHFDGDLLVYRAGFAAEGEAVENALYNVKSVVRTTLEALDLTPDDLIMYLSGPTNFREGIATIKPYKGNRDPNHKPEHGPAIKDYMKFKYNVVVSEDEEADDVVAYSHYQMWLEDEYSSILCSTDKDLNMIPGLHYNFVKGEREYISPEAADEWFLKQLLMGDSTDNIQGVPGIGKVKATKAIEASKDPWHTIKTLYVQGYGDDWHDALVENGRLLWMRRAPNEWWNPPEHITNE